MPIATIFFAFVYIVVRSVFRGGIVPWPTHGDTWEKSEAYLKERPFFKDYYVFGTKN